MAGVAGQVWLTILWSVKIYLKMENVFRNMSSLLTFGLLLLIEIRMIKEKCDG